MKREVSAVPYEDEDPPYVEPDPELNALAHAVIGSAIEVHKQYGPGLDEALYESAMEIELRLRGVPFQPQVWIDVEYKGHMIGKRRVDLIVGDRLVVELKATTDSLTPLHKAQLRTYLKIMRLKLGLVINFNVILLKDGIHRVIHHP
jgi:GxxExxY protein